VKELPPPGTNETSWRHNTQSRGVFVKRFSLAVAAAILATTGSAQAITTTFTFDATIKGLTSIQKSQNGINLTIGNFSPGTRAGADSDGLVVACRAIFLCLHDGATVTSLYTSYTMTFDQPVKLLSYFLSFQDNALDSSTTYAQGLLQSLQVTAPGTGTVAFVNQFVAAPNVPITVTTTDTDTPWNRW
jgi:hypothetical protein